MRASQITSVIEMQREQTIDTGRAEFLAYVSVLKRYGGECSNDVKGDREILTGLLSNKYTDDHDVADIKHKAVKYYMTGEEQEGYKPTLREAMRLYIYTNSHRHDDTLKKVQTTTKAFLSSVRQHDIQLADISRILVREWIDELAGDGKKASTISGHLSRLKTIFGNAYKSGVSNLKEKPFEDHTLAHLRSPTQKKQLFDKPELKKLVAWADTLPLPFKTHFYISLFAGARANEIQSLLVGDVRETNGVLFFNIGKSKTSAGVRRVPFANHIKPLVLELMKDKGENDSLLGLNAKKFSREFSRFKVDNVTPDSTKTLHSLRNLFIRCAYDAGVKEEICSAIVGHKTGKGMSYNYYLRFDLEHLIEAVELASK